MRSAKDADVRWNFSRSSIPTKMIHYFLINSNPDENFLQWLKYAKDEKSEYSPSKSFLYF